VLVSRYNDRMVGVKSPEQIEMIRIAGRVVAEGLHAMKDAIVPDKTTTLDLDEVAAEVCKKRGAKAAFLGYQPSFSDVPFKYYACISVNEEIVHGQPSATHVLKTGDIVSLDFGVSVDGWFADSAITVPVGEVSLAAKNLLRVTEDAMMKGIGQARAGHHVEDISYAVQRHAERSRYGVVRSLTGHGIGQSPHEEPQVPNYGKPGRGLLLRPGMVICIEPMINLHSHGAVHVPGDDWTIVTSDGSISAHFEHTIAITEEGPDILTLLDPGEK